MDLQTTHVRCRDGGRLVGSVAVVAGNCVFTSEDCRVLKLCDFGFSTRAPSPGRTLRDVLGTPSFTAPEVWLRSYTELCDMWSLCARPQL